MAIPEEIKDQFSQFRQYTDLGVLALMEAKHTPTGEIHHLFVVVDPHAKDKVNVYPVGRLFTDDNIIDQYQPPNPDSPEGWGGIPVVR